MPTCRAFSKLSATSTRRRFQGRSRASRFSSSRLTGWNPPATATSAWTISARPEDELARAQSAGVLHRNFMGYTTHAGCELIGFGMSAISHFGDSFSQNHRDLSTWQAALDSGQLPVWRGLALYLADDLVRADVIQCLMCDGAVDFAEIESRHGIRFESYFADALARCGSLVADGPASLAGRQLRATDRRFLLRIVAMCFDRDPTPRETPAVAHESMAKAADAVSTRASRKRSQSTAALRGALPSSHANVPV